MFLDISEVRERLTQHVNQAGYFGAKNAFARLAGYPDCNHVCLIEQGKKGPGERMQKALGIRAILLYEVVGDPVQIPPKRPRRSRVAVSMLHDPYPPPGTARVVHRMFDDEGENNGKAS